MADPHGTIDWRVVPETVDLDIAKSGDPIHHWTVFRGPDDWTPLGTYGSEAEARAAIANVEGAANG